MFRLLKKPRNAREYCGSIQRMILGFQRHGDVKLG
jgi:hypothetical protein